MARLIANKAVRYPRGRGGRDYVAGEEFEALSDRDIKALTLAKIARLAPASAEAPARRGPGRPRKIETIEPQPTPSHTYERRDMVPED